MIEIVLKSKIRLFLDVSRNYTRDFSGLFLNL